MLTDITKLKEMTEFLTLNGYISWWDGTEQSPFIIGDDVLNKVGMEYTIIKHIYPEYAFVRQTLLLNNNDKITIRTPNWEASIFFTL